jgi:hypothetical protein
LQPPPVETAFDPLLRQESTIPRFPTERAGRRVGRLHYAIGLEAGQQVPAILDNRGDGFAVRVRNGLQVLFGAERLLVDRLQQRVIERRQLCYPQRMRARALQ